MPCMSASSLYDSAMCTGCFRPASRKRGACASTQAMRTRSRTSGARALGTAWTGSRTWLNGDDGATNQITVRLDNGNVVVSMATNGGEARTPLPERGDPDRDQRGRARGAAQHALGGDIVLLAGKGHEHSIIGPGGPRPWNERAEAEALESRQALVGQELTVLLQGSGPWVARRAVVVPHVASRRTAR